ncbi:MAG: hypothetical protein H6657_27740 [Ardenticatenaceae bacterium]|nr:hypothetical protein [Ardenticatenaceae bacterium]
MPELLFQSAPPMTVGRFFFAKDSNEPTTFYQEAEQEEQARFFLVSLACCTLVARNVFSGELTRKEVSPPFFV